MSTKTFPYRPLGSGDNLLIFVVISVTIHILFALGLLSIKPFARQSAPREKEPVEVELLSPPKVPEAEKTKPRYVVEIPPGPAAATAPKDFTHYADRNSKVDKETYPEVTRKPAPRALKDTVAGRPANGAEIKKEPAVKAATRPSDGVNLPGVTAGDTYKSLSQKSKAVQDAGVTKKTAVSEKGSAANTATREVPGLPDLFPTHERITELEKKYEAEAPAGEKGKTLQLNTSELRYQKYIINMKNRIEFYWEYPPLAARNGWQGIVNISFTIKKDGKVTNISVTKSSNYPVLDDTAVTALRLAGPFPPFPDNFGVEEININGQFEYKFYGGPSGQGG